MSDSSFSIQSDTGTVTNSFLFSRMTTRAMPALMICRLHMEQLEGFSTYSPVLAAFPSRYKVDPIISGGAALMIAFAAGWTERQTS